MMLAPHEVGGDHHTHTSYMVNVGAPNHSNEICACMVRYSAMLLALLTLSILVLPLVLPPLPPPPLMLLFVPVFILVFLFLLAFSPSTLPNMASLSSSNV